MAQIPMGQQQRQAQIGHISDGINPSLTVPRIYIKINFENIFKKSGNYLDPVVVASLQVKRPFGLH